MGRITDISPSLSIDSESGILHIEHVMGDQISHVMTLTESRNVSDLTGYVVSGVIEEISTAIGEVPEPGYTLPDGGEAWAIPVDVGGADGTITFTIPSGLGEPTGTLTGRTGLPTNTPRPGQPKRYQGGIRFTAPGGTSREMRFTLSLFYSVVGVN